MSTVNLENTLFYYDFQKKYDFSDNRRTKYIQVLCNS